MSESSTAPAWQREPLVVRVANALLDRIDRGPRDRVRAPRLKLDEHIALELFATLAQESDYQWSLLQRMQQAGWIRILTDSADPQDANIYRNPRIELTDELALRQITQRTTSTEADWQTRFLSALGQLLPAGHPALEYASRGTLPLQTYDPVLVAQRLVSVRELAEEPLLLREVSSRLFFAQSKALDGREALVSAVLGVAECPFPEVPVQLTVQLPVSEFVGVLFVENLVTFEALIRRNVAQIADEIAVVYASGYRCSAKRLRVRDGVSVYFAASTLPDRAHADRFLGWLARESPEVPVWFYGDLDYAGLGILAKLRQSFVEAQAWRPGYEVLLSVLEAGGGHAPEAAQKSGQRDPEATGCSYSDTVLLPAIRKHGRFVDQELTAWTSPT